MAARTARAGEHVILEDIDLDLRRGQAIGVIGESGSGKTTLARVVAGLLAPCAGTIEFDGRPLPPALGAVARARSCAASRSCSRRPTRRSIRRTRSSASWRGRCSSTRACRATRCERRIDELLDLVKLPRTLADRLPSGLSGGQKQRVNLARALAAEPDLILCDEVTSALDTVVAAAILDLMAELRRELGVSYLFISHDLTRCERYATRSSSCAMAASSRKSRAQITSAGRITRTTRSSRAQYPSFGAAGSTSSTGKRRPWRLEGTKMTPTFRIAAIPGDGIGKEVMPEGLRVLKAAGERFDFALDVREIDWASCDYYAQHGQMMPDDWKEQLAGVDAIYFGAVGWPATVPDHVSLWGSLLKFRREFDQYVNLRPVRLMPGVPSPLAGRKPGDIDFWSCARTPRASTRQLGGRDVRGHRARVRDAGVGVHAHRRRPRAASSRSSSRARAPRKHVTVGDQVQRHRDQHAVLGRARRGDGEALSRTCASTSTTSTS